MADVVNLNRFRKRRRKQAEQAEAERNRVIHGQTKADKLAARRLREREAQALDGHQREAPFEAADETPVEPRDEAGPGPGPQPTPES